MPGQICSDFNSCNVINVKNKKKSTKSVKFVLYNTVKINVARVLNKYILINSQFFFLERFTMYNNFNYT